MSKTPLRKTSTPGIFKRDNRYVVILRDRNGKQFKRFAETMAQARQLKATLTADVARGELTVTKRMTFTEYAEEWKTTYRGRTSKGIRENTLAEYKRVIDDEAASRDSADHRQGQAALHL